MRWRISGLTTSPFVGGESENTNFSIFLSSIKINGLLPQGRQYVHLSQDISTAQSVGLRRDNKPCVLQIDAKRAWEDGILFYFGNEKVWLADVIPSKYITEI